MTDSMFSGNHPAIERSPILVAPTLEGAFNLVRAGIIPVACFRVDDIDFAFDSSFVEPGIAPKLVELKKLRETHKGSKLSVFGHADPTGNDEYNKFLSGRRAAAIYALLTRRTDIWEDLFSNKEQFTRKVAGDSWGEKALQVMKSRTGSNEDVQTLKKDKGKRAVLFEQYMDALCGAEFKLDKEDFLARGVDKEGKGDYQGCGEFNPILVFSKDEAKRFQKPENKAERDANNQPNRRVMILLFRANAVVDPAKWPCPKAKDGVGGCKKRFFPDGEKRRDNQAERREFRETKDTFACRFYQRLNDRSPCERVLITFSFRLYDLERRFIAAAPFELVVGGNPPIKGLANDKGFAVVPGVEVPNEVVLRWGFPPESGEEPMMVFESEVFLNPDDGDPDTETEARQKLQNLGYPQDAPLDENTAAFQRDYGELANPPLRETGELDDATMALLRDVFASAEDNLQQDKPERTSVS